MTGKRHSVSVDLALVRAGVDVISAVVTTETSAGERTVSVQPVRPEADGELEAATGRPWARVGSELALIVGGLCAIALREPDGWTLSVYSLAHGIRLEHFRELDAQGVAERLAHWPEFRT